MNKKPSFEERLTNVSSPEKVKSAKLLLKNDRLLGAWRDAGGRVNAVFSDKGKIFATNVKTGDEPHCKCECGTTGGLLCEHSVAALMYSGRFRVEPPPLPVEDEASYCSSLKFESWESMAVDSAADKKQATVWITSESAFPHLPSKWENTLLNVKITCGNREYLGNLSNLRSLHFDKTLAASLKLTQFSLQERQIIRFLAINAEPDNSKLCLNSEQTAEFFHALIGFERFTRDNQRLIIHKETAEPVVITSGTGAEKVYTPGIRINGALLPIKSAKVITGKCGCWIGKSGEYWWIPATLDVAWIRSFFRAGEHKLTEVPVDTPPAERLPVPVCGQKSLVLASPHPTVLLECDFPSPAVMRLHPVFLYNGTRCVADDSRLGLHNGEFFLRDDRFERIFTEHLAMFGLVRGPQEYLTLTGVEKIGVFLDKMLPEFVARKDVALAGNLAWLSRGGAGVPELQLAISNPVQEEDLIKVDFRIFSGDDNIHPDNAVTALKQGQRYIQSSSGNILHIGENLANLLQAGVVKTSGRDGNQWSMAAFSVPFFLQLASAAGASIPAELYSYAPAAMPAFVDTREQAGKFTGKLRSYQEEGVRWLTDRVSAGFNVILADEMGLGKTVQILAFLAAMRRKGDAPALVIAPASLLENWRREALRFVSGYQVMVLTGQNKEEWAKLPEYDLAIISYAIARREEAVLKKYRFGILILDEAQHIKNPGTANAHSCKAVRAEHKVVLTGTPLENSADDLWSIFDFLHPGILGSLASFQRRYGNIKNDSGLRDELAGRIAPFIKRRTKKLVAAELPPKSEITLFCEMDSIQRKLYEKMLKQARGKLAQAESDFSQPQSRMMIFTELLRLRQLCCDPSLLPDNEGLNCPSAKMELAKELIMENIDSGHRMLLFSQFTSLLAIFRQNLSDKGIAYEYLDGATRNRIEKVDNFNNSPDIPIFLLSIKAGGSGLNLTSADRVIIYDPWWNPAVENQATDRTHRIGQTRQVTSVKLVVKDSIEERILELQKSKQDIFDGLVDNPQACASELTLEDLKFLLN